MSITVWGRFEAGARIRFGFCPSGCFLEAILVEFVIIIEGITCHLKYSQDHCIYMSLSPHTATDLPPTCPSDPWLQWSYATSNNYS